MFVRWQSRKRTKRSPAFGSFWGEDGKRYYDTTWTAVLVEGRRVNGKPRQKHIAYLGSFPESALSIPHQRGYFWNHIREKLDRLGDRITADQRANIEGKIAERVPPLTAAEKRRCGESVKKYGLTVEF